MFLSIIIPVYNVEKYLPECLDSCLNQDIPLSDYEIICVDDGSPDNCGAILDNYAEKYDNIVVIHKENGGVSSARNAGIDVARGDYMWFVDSDDTIKANLLKGLKKHIYETACDILSVRAYMIHNDNDYIEAVTNPRKENIVSSNGYVCMHIYKKELINIKPFRFDIKVKCSEDELFYVQVVRAANKSERIDDIVYYYRQQEYRPKTKSINESIESFISAIIALKTVLEKETVIFDIEKKFFREKYIYLGKLLSKLSYVEYRAYIKRLKNENLILKSRQKSDCKYYIPTEKEYLKMYLKKKLIKFFRKFKYSNLKEHISNIKGRLST